MHPGAYDLFATAHQGESNMRSLIRALGGAAADSVASGRKTREPRPLGTINMKQDEDGTLIFSSDKFYLEKREEKDGSTSLVLFHGVKA